LDFETPDKGCCGMAGSFGFEAKHYDVSMKVGERVLLPAVRRAAEDTLILANGFSCHEQIEQGTGRTPLHLAQVIRMALRERAGAPAGVPQAWRGGDRAGAPNGRPGAGTALLVGAGVVAGGLVAWNLLRPRTR
jgi:hypothetical protein